MAADATHSENRLESELAAVADEDENKVESNIFRVHHQTRVVLDSRAQFINFQIPIRSTIKPINEINVWQYWQHFCFDGFFLSEGLSVDASEQAFFFFFSFVPFFRCATFIGSQNLFGPIRQMYEAKIDMPSHRFETRFSMVAQWK